MNLGDGLAGLIPGICKTCYFLKHETFLFCLNPQNKNPAYLFVHCNAIWPVNKVK
jgi:hypothetical protein